MHIDSKGFIAGQPALRVRKFLRAYDWWSIESVCDHFQMTVTLAQQFTEGLVSLGLAAARGGRDKEWEATPEGRRTALASAAKQLTKRTADRVREALLQRVDQVNRDPRFLYKVTRVVLFGSSLSTSERLSDVDLAIDLKPKETDPRKHREKSDRKIEAARMNGKRFRNMFDEIYWPQQEVLSFLKSRSRALELHTMDELEQMNVTGKTIYPRDDGRMGSVTR